MCCEQHFQGRVRPQTPLPQAQEPNVGPNDLTAGDQLDSRWWLVRMSSSDDPLIMHAKHAQHAFRTRLLAAGVLLPGSRAVEPRIPTCS